MTDKTVVVSADDLDKMLAAYIEHGRTVENAAEGDAAWERLHAAMKTVQACPRCIASAARVERSPAYLPSDIYQVGGERGEMKP